MTAHGTMEIDRVVESKAISQKPQADDMVMMIERVVRDSSVDISRLERLIDLKRSIDVDAKRDAFAAAMSRLQAKLPQIEKTGRIMERDGKGVRSTFAKLETLDAQIRPYLAEEGFAFSYDTAPGPQGDIRVIGKLSHMAGHFELKQIDMPIDDGGAKSKVQSRGSTLSYGIRQLLRMHLNLVMKEEDDDGTGEWNKAISEDQARTIQDLVEETGSDKDRFLKHFAINELRELRARQYDSAVTMLEAKRRK
jgi:hypothetical protein